MNLPRREFLSKLGLASASVMATHPLFGKIATSLDSRSVLVETAYFSHVGGWQLDTQFENELGFSYLLAHGLGKPVEDAVAKIRFPSAGRYHAWVLTKDWCPGNWDSPGRFKISLNDSPLEETFGTQPGWSWQSGGSVQISDQQLSSEISLQDLTGFEGRCSAVYFSLDSGDVPPADLATLPVWRRRKAGLSSDVLDQGNYDVVIVGGGISGCAAALAANERGIKVALIQNRPVLGGNASGEIRVHTLGIHNHAAAILEQIDTPHYPNGDADALVADKKRMRNMNAAENVDIFLNHSLISAETEGNRIQSIQVVESASGNMKRFASPQFIDCTGDGWLGEMAGADFRYGRESKNEFDEGWDRHGELWSPEKPDNRVMGSSVLWYTKETNRRVRFPAVPWAKPVAKDHVSPKGEWQWEFSHDDLHQIEDAETIRDHMFRAIYGTYANTIRRPQYANLELDWMAFVAGKRESRRLIGPHIFTGVDARDSVQFPDTVVTEKRSIDVHYQETLLGRPEDFLSEALFLKPRDGVYYIPYRSLFSHNVANLQMAGRCFSCTHIGLGGPRVMNTCGQMGVATGYAAALCHQYRVDPANISAYHIGELRQLCGYNS
jgi:hypothetical protein